MSSISCGINSCHSGQILNNNNRKAQLIKFYKVKKDKVGLWNEILNQELTELDYVCEKHFSILKTYESPVNISSLEFSCENVRKYLVKYSLPSSGFTWKSTSQGEIILKKKVYESVGCRFLIKNDMSVEGTTLDKLIKIEVRGKITSEEKLKKLITNIEVRTWCDGTGLNSTSSPHKRSPICTGYVLPLDDFFTLKNYARCFPCRILRKRSHKRIRRNNKPTQSAVFSGID